MDKYCFTELNPFCESQLLKRLCAPTVVLILKIACEASRQELKDNVLNFITEDEARLCAAKDTRCFDPFRRELTAEAMEAFLHRADATSGHRRR